MVLPSISRSDALNAARRLTFPAPVGPSPVQTDPITPPPCPFELGWNTLRDLLLAEGNAGLIGSRDTLRLAFRVGLIGDGEAWLAMVQDRNLMSHTSNRSTAEQVSEQVAARPIPVPAPVTSAIRGRSFIRRFSRG